MKDLLKKLFKNASVVMAVTLVVSLASGVDVSTVSAAITAVQEVVDASN